MSTLDRLGARAVTSSAARGLAFFADFAAALIRAARGNPQHPEERRAEPPSTSAGQGVSDQA